MPNATTVNNKSAAATAAETAAAETGATLEFDCLLSLWKLTLIGSSPSRPSSHDPYLPVPAVKVMSNETMFSLYIRYIYIYINAYMFYIYIFALLFMHSMPSLLLPSLHPSLFLLIHDKYI